MDLDDLIAALEATNRAEADLVESMHQEWLDQMAPDFAAIAADNARLGAELQQANAEYVAWLWPPDGDDKA